MPSAIAARAIQDATTHGRAILKFISPNDVGLTGGHQCGFYLPKSVWQMYSPHPPERGENKKSWPKVLWQDGRVTDSCVTWYGSGTRSEYRLTRFGRDFPYLNPDSVGDLLVLIPKSHDEFIAYVLDTEDDIEEVQAALGIEVAATWGVYDAAAAPVETEDECIDRQFREFASRLDAFPPTHEFSTAARRALDECIRAFREKNPDDRLLAWIDAEYRLFRLVERRLCAPEIQRLFRSVDDFLQTASRIMNRRKSRAGWSLEHHFEHLLTEAAIPFAARSSEIEGEPDIVIPSVEAYNDPAFPEDRLCVLGVKTTCKDRWRQVLNEARRVRRKHILTLQPGISANQLRAMQEAGVQLVVPENLQHHYPPNSGVELLSVERFLGWARGLAGERRRA